jgi:HAE1 family hydrophobic/amphiphilic exporter-1
MVASLSSPIADRAFSLPFVCIGAFLALLITGATWLAALMGFLMLIGIVVTNAIAADQLRGAVARARPSCRRGADRRGRSREADPDDSAGDHLALVPLVLGLGTGIIIAAELATVVIGGLFTSTVLTLVVIPVLYSLYNDAMSRVRSRGGANVSGG